MLYGYDQGVLVRVQSLASPVRLGSGCELKECKMEIQECAEFDLERDFQGGAEGVVRDLQWRSEEGVVRGSAVGHALYCRAVGMLGRGFDAGVLMSVWEWKGKKGQTQGFGCGWRRPQCRTVGPRRRVQSARARRI